MRAAIFQGPGQKLTIGDVPFPVPARGQMVMKVKHCGICGTDLRITSGEVPIPSTSAVVLGHEFCGEIVEVGPEIADWKVGDRATSLPLIGCGECPSCMAGEPVWCASMRSHAFGMVAGGFAEYVLIGARSTVKVPEGVSWREAALTEPLASGLHGVLRADLQPGADVLVFGAGALGLAVTIWARALGARHVVVTARSSRNADMALRLGATEFVESDRDVGAAFSRLTGGPPAILFECVGAQNVLDSCIALAGPRGRIVSMGDCRTPSTIHTTPALFKELDIKFSLEYSMRDYQAVVDLIARGRIDPDVMISDEVGLEAFPDALEALRHPEGQCKVLLTPGLASNERH